MYSVLLSEARGFSDCGNWQNRTRTQRDQILNRWDLQIITQTLNKKVVPAVQLVIIITRKDTAQWSTVSSPGTSTSTQGSRSKKISTASVSDTNVKVATTRVEDGLSGHVRMHCSCHILHHHQFQIRRKIDQALSFNILWNYKPNTYLFFSETHTFYILLVFKNLSGDMSNMMLNKYTSKGF